MSSQDKVDNLLKICEKQVVFNWEQYSVKDITMFLEQSVDLIKKDENRVQYPRPNIFQQNFLKSQHSLKSKLTAINIKYEKLLAPPCFSS
jgi:hypothetical protein